MCRGPRIAGKTNRTAPSQSHVTIPGRKQTKQPHSGKTQPLWQNRTMCTVIRPTTLVHVSSHVLWMTNDDDSCVTTYTNIYATWLTNHTDIGRICRQHNVRRPSTDRQTVEPHVGRGWRGWRPPPLYVRVHLGGGDLWSGKSIYLWVLIEYPEAETSLRMCSPSERCAYNHSGLPTLASAPRR